MIEPIAFAAAFLIIDQWSKRLALARKSRQYLSLSPFLRIRAAPRVGPTWRNSTRASLVLLWLTALACAALLHHSGWFHDRTALLGVALAFGGAAGNLLDILRYRYIVDFIEIPRWWVFNLADVAIVLGLTAALLA